MVRRALGLALGLCWVCTQAGCSEPYAKIVQVQCKRVLPEGKRQAMSFSSRVETAGLANQQIVYKVTLLAAIGDPVQSRDSRYRDSWGSVAASRSVLIPESPWVMENLVVSIPLHQMELRSERPPRLAEFALYLANGVCLDRKWAGLPIRYPEDARLRPSPPAEHDCDSGAVERHGGLLADQGRNMQGSARGARAESSDQETG